MVIKDLESPLLTTGGITTAIYQFIQGDDFNIILGALATLSVVFLNVVRAYIKLKKMKDEED